MYKVCKRFNTFIKFLPSSVRLFNVNLVIKLNKLLCQRTHKILLFITSTDSKDLNEPDMNVNLHVLGYWWQLLSAGNLSKQFGHSQIES